jgi:hypothetical protein
MHWRKRVTEDLETSNRVLGFATLVCGVMLIVICSIGAAGQDPKDQQTPKAATPTGTKLITLPVDTIIRVKAAQKVASSRVKVGDYVQFEVAENVIEKTGVAEPQILIAKGTPVFGRVVQHKNRVLVFRAGVVAVTIDNITAVDGTPIKVLIARHQVTLAGLGTNEAAGLREILESEKRELNAQLKPNPKFCRDLIRTNTQNPRNDKLVTCIKGRVYISNFTSSLPSAVVAALTTTGLVLVKDSTAEAAAAVTLAGQFASNSGFSNILNGSYAEIDLGEIFDAVPDQPYTIVVPDKAAAPAPKPAPKKGEVRIQRFHNPTPVGFLETDYFSDLEKYPNYSGEKYFYTGKVIERYDNKKKGDTMRMCVEGQTIPDGFMEIDAPIDPSVCPREPTATNSRLTYKVILRMRDPKSP